MNKAQRKRLEILRDDLLKNPKGFDIKIFKSGNKCCAIGRCPELFPGWQWNQTGKDYIWPTITGEQSPLLSANKFFGTTDKEFQDLFTKLGYPDKPTAKDVADKITAKLSLT